VASAFRGRRPVERMIRQRVSGFGEKVMRIPNILEHDWTHWSRSRN
jgi:hypothetical protein